MKQLIKSIYRILIVSLIALPLGVQGQADNPETTFKETDLSDRQAILQTIENFYIGDHTGSIEHKKLSMHEQGAYRYVNRDGDYAEYIFPVDSNDADPSFKEELQSIEIYDTVALARIRQQNVADDGVHYKLMILHKVKGNWIITTISWGSQITP